MYVVRPLKYFMNILFIFSKNRKRPYLHLKGKLIVTGALRPEQVDRRVGHLAQLGWLGLGRRATLGRVVDHFTVRRVTQFIHRH